MAGLGLMGCCSSFVKASVLMESPDCAASGGGWACYLPGIHRFLLVIAIVLGLLLLGVVGVALKSYLKIKHDEKVDS